MTAARRWAYACLAALVLVSVTVGAVWGFDWMRTQGRVDSCLDRGGVWDYDAGACQTN